MKGKQSKLEIIAEKKKLHPDPCEWNPETNRPAYWDEVHASAVVIVGANGQWRLCGECAKLPKFKRFKIRKKVNK